ncbi:monovalent cation/H(+) antiporter subunit G [Pontibacter burrus]|uniref:Monovalent cation/H(+) antiporter subunit G n=1 Tax=Pontibacter burrus TaxID=2704466 RepID=A0A6B3LY55_9BACT|nr:monovalent cation/H(+) antiporter subunit G [Pontibacter burrus]NEM98738.1 monovalent cation/H(+) antiporter subunit G [Pontibacter burrus]
MEPLILNINKSHELISSLLILLGVVFLLLSSIGLLRFPDFYTRMSAVTKGSTMGLGLILIGLSVYFNNIDVSIKILLILFFTFLTSPVAAHVISRTAVKLRVPFWSRTNIKEFEDYLKRENAFEPKDKPDEFKKD